MRSCPDAPVRRPSRLPRAPDRRGPGLLAWAVLWVLVARVVHEAVLVLAEPGDAVADLGRSISDTMSSAAGVAEDVPVVGDDLSDPFDALGDAGGAVTGAGTSGLGRGAHAGGRARRRAGGAAGGLAAAPLGPVAAAAGCGRPPPPTGCCAYGADGLPDLELLAARAMATAPLPQLARLPAGTGAGWRAGDPAALHALAGLELRRLGLRAPPSRRRPAEWPSPRPPRSAWPRCTATPSRRCSATTSPSWTSTRGVAEPTARGRSARDREDRQRHVDPAVRHRSRLLAVRAEQRDGAVLLTFPDGTTCAVDGPEAAGRLSRHVGQPVTLAPELAVSHARRRAGCATGGWVSSRPSSQPAGSASATS